MIACSIWQDEDCPYHQISIDPDGDPLDIMIPKSLYKRYEKMIKEFDEVQEILQKYVDDDNIAW